jgi:hypothetical protein
MAYTSPFNSVRGAMSYLIIRTFVPPTVRRLLRTVRARNGLVSIAVRIFTAVSEVDDLDFDHNIDNTLDEVKRGFLCSLIGQN